MKARLINKYCRHSRAMMSALVAVSMAACNSGGSPSPSSPPTAPQNKSPAPDQSSTKGGSTMPTVPAPSPGTLSENQPSQETIESDLNIQPNDKLGMLFSRYVTERSPIAAQSSATGLSDEIYSDKDMVKAKIFVIRQYVGKLGDLGYYTPETADRIEYLESMLASREDRNAQAIRSEAAGEGIFFVASFAVLGSLAGSHAFDGVPKAIPALKRQFESFLGESRTKLVRTYVRGKEAIPSRGEAVAMGRSAAKGVGDKTSALAGSVRDSVTSAARVVRMSPEELLHHDLEVADLSSIDIANLGDIRATDRFGVASSDWQNTKARGLRYAMIDHWSGEPLEAGKKRIAFEVTRPIPGNPVSTYYLTDELDQGIAENLTGQMQPAVTEAEGARKAVWFVDPDTGKVSLVKMPVAKFRDLLNRKTEELQPLFARVDWPNALKIGIASGAISSLAYYWGFENGVIQGAPAEKMIQLDTGVRRAPQSTQPKSAERL